MDENRESREIDLMEIIGVLWRKIIIILITSVVCAACFFEYTYYAVTPLYKSSVLLYVNNSSISLGSSSIKISPSDISAAKSLVDTYIVVLKTRSTLNEVIKEAELKYSYGQLEKMIDAGSVNGTEIFKVTVTSPNEDEAEMIANTIALVLPEKISDIVDGSDVRVVDYAVRPTARSSPSYTKNTAIGFAIGFIVSVAIIIIIHLFDNVVRNEEQISKAYSIPILASIPDMSVGGGGKYGYGKYGKYSKYYSYGETSSKTQTKQPDGRNELRQTSEFKKNITTGGDGNGNKQ